MELIYKLSLLPVWPSPDLYVLAFDVGLGFFCLWTVLLGFFCMFGIELQMRNTHVWARQHSVKVCRIPIFLFYLLLLFYSSSDVKYQKLMSVIPSASRDIVFLHKRNILRLIALAYTRELIYITNLCSAFKQSHTTAQPLF